jgi:RimJ/RimL family protein N-acetyltransferase
MMRFLETERLWLRPLELADAVATQELFPRWEIVRYLATQVPWPYPKDGAFHYLSEIALPATVRGEEWHWSLRLKSDPRRLIGSIALIRSGGNNRGFWIGLPWQGMGLMSEASEAVNDYWFGELGFPVMRVPKAAENRASSRISEKNGMRLVGTEERDYVGGRFMTELWEMTLEEWRARRGKTRSLDAKSDLS